MERSKYSFTTLARTSGERLGRDFVISASLQPSFSARTLSAASVGSPTFA